MSDKKLSFKLTDETTPQTTAEWLETLASLILAGYSRESLELLASALTTETTPDYKDLGKQMTQEKFEEMVFIIRGQLDPPGISDTQHLTTKHVERIAELVLQGVGIEITE